MKKNIFGLIFWISCKPLIRKKNAKTWGPAKKKLSFGTSWFFNASTIFVTNERLTTDASRNTLTFHTFRCQFNFASGQTIQLKTAGAVFFICGTLWIRYSMQWNIDWPRWFGQYAFLSMNANIFFIFQISIFAETTTDCAVSSAPWFW